MVGCWIGCVVNNHVGVGRLYCSVQVARSILTKPLASVRDELITDCVETLYRYRRYSAPDGSSSQLLLPESLRLLPVYTLRCEAHNWVGCFVNARAWVPAVVYCQFQSE